jgi:hypothetical protein
MCRIDGELRKQILEQIFDKDELQKISPSNYNKASLLNGFLFYCLVKGCDADVE